MKKLFYVLLLAVFAFSIGVSTADAAWTTGFTTGKKVCLYTSSTLLASQTGDTNVFYTLAAGESLVTNDTVTITLSGGAKFSTSAPLLFFYPAPVDSTIVAYGGSVLAAVGSATGLTTANFAVAGNAPVGVGILLNTTNAGATGIFDLSAATGNVDITIKAIKSGSGLTAFEKVMSTTTAIAAVNKYAFLPPAACDAVNVVTRSDIADVSAATGGPYTKFTTASPTTTSGTITSANYRNFGTANGVSPAGGPINAKKVLWTISGDLSGISQISAAGAVTGSSSTGSTTGGTANVFLIATGNLLAYATNTAAIAADGSVDPAPQFILNGTTAQAARSFNVAIDILVDGTTWAAHTVQATTQLYSITRNGVSFVTNSVGPRNTIKITERSGSLPTAGGSILVTAWDVNGNSLAEASGNAALTILNNETVTITGTALAARFTGTPMKYEFAIQSSNAVATNVKVSTDGVSTATTVYTNNAGAI